MEQKRWSRCSWLPSPAMGNPGIPMHMGTSVLRCKSTTDGNPETCRNRTCPKVRARSRCFVIPPCSSLPQTRRSVHGTWPCKYMLTAGMYTCTSGCGPRDGIQVASNIEDKQHQVDRTKLPSLIVLPCLDLTSPQLNYAHSAHPFIAALQHQTTVIGKFKTNHRLSHCPDLIPSFPYAS